ncbi:MAG: chorismate synthase [Candidatus Thermoplasmatota archaeon]|nr:chorismate synthase [Candidatus Thermoplasmatota archaeon]
MGNTIGHMFRVTTWGESHGDSMGCVIDGCPAGLKMGPDIIREELDRDVPYPVLTRRVEENRFQILSGVFQGETIGTPISIIIRNSNVESDKYLKIMSRPRPGHADLAYRMKYGHVDWRGGSRASGRTWAPIIAAGGVARSLCSIRNVRVGSSIVELGGRPITDSNLRSEIERLAETSAKEEDATGGIIEVRIEGLPPGLGAPAFNRFHADLGHGILSIPGIKSFELGSSREAAKMKATEFNDPIRVKNGIVAPASNRAGGVLGGITCGPPVVFRAIVKPTPSVLSFQDTVDLTKMENATISTEGRFDANYTPRVLVVAEAVSAIVTVDHLMISGILDHDSLVPRQERLRYDFKT